MGIRKQGFPFRFLHEDFYKRFRCITKPKLARLKSGFSQGCRAILKQVAQRPMAKVVSNCKVGQTMILYRSKESAALELLRAIVAEKNGCHCTTHQGSIDRCHRWCECHLV